MGKTLKIAKVRQMLARGEARDIRCRSGLSVAELAGELGVSPTTVWYWENARHVPKGDRAERYLEILERLEWELSK